MVHEKVRICEDPLIFLFDTPGVLTPRISDRMTGMKLAACGKKEGFFVPYLRGQRNENIY